MAIGFRSYWDELSPPKAKLKKTLVVKPRWTQAQLDAMKRATDIRMGAHLMKSKMVQRNILGLRILGIRAEFVKGGAPLSPPQVGILANVEARRIRWESGYKTKVAMTTGELEKGTYKYGVSEGQKEIVIQKYQELLAQPPKEEGMDWGKLAIFGVVAIGALIALSAFMTRRRD